MRFSGWPFEAKISTLVCINEGLIRRVWQEREQGQKLPSSETNLS
jgi:hypothetical protein